MSRRELGDLAPASLIKPRGEAAMFDSSKGLEAPATFWDAGHEWQGELGVSVTSLLPAEALLEGVQLAGTGKGAGRDPVEDCSILPQYFQNCVIYHVEQWAGIPKPSCTATGRWGDTKQLR